MGFEKILGLFSLVEIITISDVITLGFSRATAGRKLSELVKQGKLEKIGSGKGSHYKIVPR